MTGGSKHVELWKIFSLISIHCLNKHGKAKHCIVQQSIEWNGIPLCVEEILIIEALTHSQPPNYSSRVSANHTGKLLIITGSRINLNLKFWKKNVKYKKNRWLVGSQSTSELESPNETWIILLPYLKIHDFFWRFTFKMNWPKPHIRSTEWTVHPFWNKRNI